MSTFLPNWLLGRHATAVTVTPQIVTNTSTGALGASTVTVQSLLGIVDEISYRGVQQTEAIQSLTSLRQHEVPIANDDSLELVELLRTGAGNSLLAKCWQTSDSADYAIVVVTRGGNTWTFTGLMESYSEQVTRGRSTAKMTFRMVNVGNTTADPLYTSP